MNLLSANNRAEEGESVANQAEAFVEESRLGVVVDIWGDQDLTLVCLHREQQLASLCNKFIQRVKASVGLPDQDDVIKIGKNLDFRKMLLEIRKHTLGGSGKQQRAEHTPLTNPLFRSDGCNGSASPVTNKQGTRAPIDPRCETVDRQELRFVEQMRQHAKPRQCVEGVFEVNLDHDTAGIGLEGDLGEIAHHRGPVRHEDSTLDP